MKTIAHVPTSFTWNDGKETIPDNDRNVLVRARGYYRNHTKDYTCFGFYIHPQTMEFNDFLLNDYFDDNEWREFVDRKEGYEGKKFDSPEYYWMKEGWWSYDPMDEETSYPLGEIIGWEEIPK